MDNNTVPKAAAKKSSAKKVSRKKKVQLQNRDRQRRFKMRRKEAGFLCRSYMIHESQLDRVKAYIDRVNKPYIPPEE
jgi:peptide deformylase